MAKQTINIGTSANDGTGSTLRAAFDITNDNFTELYDGTGGLLHKIEGTNFTGSLLIGHSTTGTLASAQQNTGVGIAALDAISSGDANTAVGKSAGSSISGGESNTIVGANAGSSLTSGSENVAIGRRALTTEDQHGGNVAIGYKALEDQNAGANAYNVAIGYEAGKEVTTGTFNVIVGALAGDALTIGPRNTVVGYQALSAEDEGRKNTAIGFNALKVLNVDGDGDNVAVGHQAGFALTTGKRNTIIGGDAGDALTTGSNNIIIGYEAAASAVDIDNEVTIGDSNITNVRIPSDSTLKIGASGDLQIEHVSSNSFIKNTAVGDLYIENQVDDKDVIFRSDNGAGGLSAYITLDGSNVRTQIDREMRFMDTIPAKFGTGGDLEISHNSTHSFITNAVGDLTIANYADDRSIYFQSDDGSGGATNYFRVDGSNEHVVYSKPTIFSDDVKLKFGDGIDLEIFHQNSSGNAFIQNYTGNLRIINNTDDGDIAFECDDGSGGTATYMFLDGSLASGGSVFTVFPDNSSIVLGTDNDLQAKHNGTDTTFDNYTGDLKFQNYADDKDIVFSSDDGSGGLAEYFRVDGSAEVTLFSKILRLQDNVRLDVGNSTDGRFFHDGTNTNLVTITGDLVIQNSNDDGNIKFRCDDGSGGNAEYFRVDGGTEKIVFSKSLSLNDNVNIGMGNSGDYAQFHDGTNTYLSNGTGDFYIRNQADDKDIIFQADDGSGGNETYFFLDGSVSAGDPYTVFPDNSNLSIGSGYDLRLKHDGTDSNILNVNGDLVISNAADDKDIIFKSDDGSGGTATYFQLDGTNTRVLYSKPINLIDSIDLQLGNSQDLKLYHNGSNSYIQDSGTGELRILASTLSVRNSGDTELMITAIEDGAVNLYHDNSKKLETTSSGVDVTGTLNLDNLTVDSAQGSDGQVLTSTGSGIAWEDAAGGGGGVTGKVEGTNFTGSIIVGHTTTGTLSSAEYNTALGINALDAITSADRNTVVGYAAGTSITSGGGNTLIGYLAGEDLVSGVNNVAVGQEALKSETNHGRNVAVGYGVLQTQNAGVHAYNTGIGYGAGGGVNTGKQNTFLGGKTGESLTTGDNNTIIGYNSSPTAADVDNEFTLGNSSVATLRCQQTSITSLSDERDKKDIETIPYGLDFVDSLKPKKFIWNNRVETDSDGNEFFSNNKGKKDIGFIAQELQTVDDDYLNLVYDSNPEKLEATYGRLIPVLVKAIQELSAKVKILENK